MSFNLARYAAEKKKTSRETAKNGDAQKSEQDDFVKKVIDSFDADDLEKKGAAGSEKPKSSKDKPSAAKPAEKKTNKRKGLEKSTDHDIPCNESEDSGVVVAPSPFVTHGEGSLGGDDLIGGGGLLKILEHLNGVLAAGGPRGSNVSHPFEMLGDEDFDGEDETVRTFKDDMGGCKGMVRVIHIGDPNALMKLSQVIKSLTLTREACRSRALRAAFAGIHAARKSGDPARQLSVANGLTRLAADSPDAGERDALLKASEAVLAGTPGHLDAAAFRVRGVFASMVPPQSGLRMAYTTLRQPNQGEPVQQCPKALYQLGRAEAMPISVCRDQCIDSRVQRDGRVSCAYSDWTRLADNNAKAMARLETQTNPDNAVNSLNLKKGERSKPLTEVERSIEQRMDEELKTRGVKTPEYSLEKQLADDKIYGHKGDAAGDTVFSLNRKASKLSSLGSVDPESEDTLGAQIEKKGHKNGAGFGDMTIEEMLADERVGLSESDLDKVLEQWLDENRLGTKTANAGFGVKNVFRNRLAEKDESGHYGYTSSGGIHPLEKREKVYYQNSSAPADAAIADRPSDSPFESTYKHSPSPLYKPEQDISELAAEVFGANPDPTKVREFQSRNGFLEIAEIEKQYALKTRSMEAARQSYDKLGDLNLDAQSRLDRCYSEYGKDSHECMQAQQEVGGIRRKLMSSAEAYKNFSFEVSGLKKRLMMIPYGVQFSVKKGDG